MVFVMADDMRADWDRMSTPWLDTFRASAMTFTRAYCQAPICNPSRFSLLTGVMPDVSKVYLFEATSPETLGARGELSFFSALRARGYRSMGVGKLFHWEPTGRPFSRYYNCATRCRFEYFPRAYDQVWGCLDGEVGGTCQEPQCVGVTSDCDRRDAIVFDGDEQTLFDVRVTDRALRLVEAGARDYLDDGRPFVLGVGFHHPHLAWRVPRRLFDPENATVAADHRPAEGAPWFAYGEIKVGNVAELRTSNGDVLKTSQFYVRKPTRANMVRMPDAAARDSRAAYLGCVAVVDEQFGRLVEGLKRAKLWDDAVVVFTSDHGYGLGEGGHWGKWSLYEIDARVPLIVRDPDAATSHGAQTNAIVELIDLARSVLDLARPARRRQPDDDDCLDADLFDGRSWRPLFAATPAADAAWNANHVAVTMVPRCLTSAAAPYICPFRSFDWPQPALVGYAARSADWRYVAWMAFNSTMDAVDWSQLPVAEELYDHHSGEPTASADDWDRLNLLSAGHAAARPATRVALRDVANHHLRLLRARARDRHVRAHGVYPFRSFTDHFGPGASFRFPADHPADRYPNSSLFPAPDHEVPFSRLFAAA